MAELKKNKVIDEKLKYLTIQEFIDKYHPGLTAPAINYAMKKSVDKIDYFTPGRERLIVLTEKTLSYRPINHPTRTRMEFKS